MSISLYILTPISGAVIGYFTNWIAIKMLFRPHKEYKFPGTNVKVPFTPGLIPKNRFDLASKVGVIIENHLLTKDAITGALLSEETFSNFDKTIDCMFSELKKNPSTIGNIITKLPGDTGDAVLDTIEEQMVKALNSVLENKSFHNNLSRFLTDKLLKLCKSEETIPVMEKLLKQLHPFADRKLREFFCCEDFKIMLGGAGREFLERLASQQKPMCDYLPESILPWLRNKAELGIPKVADLLNTLTTQNPTMEAKLKQIIRGIIDDNFGKLLGVFISEEKIYDNIKKGLTEYICDAENQRIMTEKAFEMLNGFLSNDISYLLEKLNPDANYMDNAAEKAALFIAELFENGLIDNIFEFLLGRLENDKGFNFYSLMDKAVPDIEGKLYAFIHERLGDFCKNKITDMTPGFIRKQREKLLALDVTAFINRLGDDTIIKVKRFIIDAVKLIIEKGSGYLTKSINVSKMVEKKMNEFGLQETEDIILSVVNRELNAITMLGGLFGFIIGFMPAVMSALGVG